MWKPFATGMTGTPMGMPGMPVAKPPESDDAKEGLNANLEKRKPDFSGR